ncbi:MAG: citrate synthase family protein [Curvibacter sp.]|nr:citrate synthase family protein [Curvibacter sp.]
MSWLTAAEALQLLGVRPQTLYAQVSRKAIRARPDPRDVRRSLYHEQDVRRQAQRRAGRRRDETVASAAMGWGDPVLSTAISTVREGRLFYRGQEAVPLAEQATLEDIANLLWGGAATDDPGPEVAPPLVGTASGEAVTRALEALARQVAAEASPLGQSPIQRRRQAWRVLHTVAQALIGDTGAVSLRPLHERLALAWGSPGAAGLLRRALVLLADHELNASAFAARVCASTGASLSACVLSGLATLTGPLHGGACARVLELVDASLEKGPAAVLEPRLRRGMLYPAFGHPLYPDGDVRARALLPRLTLPVGFAELQALALQAAGEHPTIDFALAAMARQHGWGPQAPLTLFALSRCVGWLAHAQEQAAQGSLIRPRARYVGPELPASPVPQEPGPPPVSRWHP